MSQLFIRVAVLDFVVILVAPHPLQCLNRLDLSVPLEAECPYPAMTQALLTNAALAKPVHRFVTHTVEVMHTTKQVTTSLSLCKGETISSLQSPCCLLMCQA